MSVTFTGVDVMGVGEIAVTLTGTLNAVGAPPTGWGVGPPDGTVPAAVGPPDA